MNNKLLPCLFIPLMLLGCSNIGNADPQSLEQGNIPVIQFCSELNQRMENLNPDKKHAYPIAGMRVMQKVKGGYLLIPDPYFSGYGNDKYDPAFLYTEQQFQQNQTLFPEMNLWSYYIGDVEYTAISGFNKKVHAYKIYNGKIISSVPKEKATIRPTDLIPPADNDKTPRRFKDSLKSDLWDK